MFDGSLCLVDAGLRLSRMLSDGHTSLEEREQLAAAAVRSLDASHRIRCCCLGERHPLSLATAAAADEARRRIAAQAAPPGRGASRPGKR